MLATKVSVFLMILYLILGAIFVGCGDSSSDSNGDTSGSDGDSDTDTDTDTDTDSDADTDTDTDTDTDSDTDADADTDTDTDADPTEVHIEGCVAAVAATCTVAERCLEEVENATSLMENAVDTCSERVEENETLISSSCRDYLEEEVPLGTPLAVYLNSASAEDIESCITGNNCTPAFLLALVNSLDEFATSGDPTDLATLIGPIVETCY